MRIYFFSLLLLSAIVFCTANATKAQSDKFYYTKASDLEQVGEILPVKNSYHRIDTAAYTKLPAIVKYLLTQSAGKAILFSTNSKSIAAKWCVSAKKQLVNLTPISQRGLDLYIRRGDEWVFAGVGRPNQNCNEEIIVNNMDDSEKECLLYLPLYDETLSLEIGIKENSTMNKIESPFKKRILIYGSSITQGASASRPGLAYPARLSRSLGIDFLNLGLSGNAKMHPEVADMISNIPADGYILDCVPNSSPLEIKERTAYMVNAIQRNHPKVPIIMIQSIVREQGNWNNQTKLLVDVQNKAYRQEYDALVAKGVNNLFFIQENDFLGVDHEGTIDGTHPNDLGFERFVDAIKPNIIDILSRYKLLNSK